MFGIGARGDLERIKAAHLMHTEHKGITEKISPSREGESPVIPPVICGYLKQDVPEQYIVTIISKALGTVRALMQDDVGFNVGSSWESFIPEGVRGVLQKIETVAEVAARRRVMSRFATRRMWKNTDPVIIRLSLRFQAEQDAYNEVVSPCRLLQGMCLPGEDKDGLLVPPGPSPFDIEVPKGAQDFVEAVKAEHLVEHITEAREKISIYIGTFLRFPSVVLSNVTVTFDSRYTKLGHPVSATVALTFETFEIITKNILDFVYRRGEARQDIASPVLSPLL